ncbi:MAG: DUF805 domain-containing protein [Alphaproteobacteria bacterium]|nr:DUF805 domain-containing protein [Alphaproteobacteria bacterium]
MSYLFGFSGRINRAKMWLFLLIAFIWVCVMLAVAAMGFDWKDFLSSLHAVTARSVPGQAVDWSTVARPRLSGTVGIAALAAVFILDLLLIVASLAVYAKRLHDRNKSAWWLLPFVIVPGVLYGYVSTATHGMAATGYAQMGLLPSLAYLVAAILGLWAFIELFFFRGTRGENRYGPDPIG